MNRFLEMTSSDYDLNSRKYKWKRSATHYRINLKLATRKTRNKTKQQHFAVFCLHREMNEMNETTVQWEQQSIVMILIDKYRYAFATVVKNKHKALWFAFSVVSAHLFSLEFHSQFLPLHKFGPPNTLCFVNVVVSTSS